jgi:WXG100 family type VII secretion target
MIGSHESRKQRQTQSINTDQWKPTERNTMAQFTVDSAQISASSAAVSASVEEIRGSVARMYSNLQQLQSVWHGSAATQFSSIADQWRTAQQGLEQSLEAIQNALAQASNLYESTESQASRLFAH